MAVRLLLGGVKSIAHVHLKLKPKFVGVLGLINNNSLFYRSSSSLNSSSTPNQIIKPLAPPSVFYSSTLKQLIRLDPSSLNSSSTLDQIIRALRRRIYAEIIYSVKSEGMNVAEEAQTQNSISNLAQFAVNKNNANKNEKLQFVRVVSSSQVRDSCELICIKWRQTDCTPNEAKKDVWIKRRSFLVECTDEEDKFIRIIDSDFVSGDAFYHDITLEAIDAGKLKNFRAVVWEERLRNLISLVILMPISEAS